MVKPELGVKRLCLSCGVRFYDFKRSPIICPSCSAQFDPENPAKSRKSRVASKSGGKIVVGTVDADDDELEENNDEMITSAMDDDSDVDIDFDDDIDVDNDDGSGVIEDDLDDDDELLPNFPDKDE